MKIIHCADIHLDSHLQTNLSAAQAKIRNLEILDTFERMVKCAAEHDVAAIIIAGDMFDTENVQLVTQQRLLNVIKTYSKIDFLYLNGNHDEANFIKQINPIPANLKIFQDTWTTFTYGPVTITGKSFEKNFTANDLRLKPQNINIVVLHGDINHEIDLRALANHSIDYLALGHLHSYTTGKIDQRGKYAYSGCLEGRGFDECGSKGFVLLNIDLHKNNINSEFVPFAQRQLFEFRFDLTGIANWFELETQIIQTLQPLDRKNLIKIILSGKHSLNFTKHVAMLNQKLKDFYVVKIVDESHLEINVADYQNDVSLRGEFIRLIMDSNLTASQKEQTILYGVRVLTGEN